MPPDLSHPTFSTRAGVPRVLARFAEADPGEPPRFLDEAACRALMTRIRGMAHEQARHAPIRIESLWSGNVRWARNRATLSADRRETRVQVWGFLPLFTNQTDPDVLAAGVRQIDKPIEQYLPGPDGLDLVPAHTYSTPAIWSDATYAIPAERRAAVMNAVAAPAEKAGLVSAGFLSVQAEGHGYMEGVTWPGHESTLQFYARQTLARCSLTVRDPRGTASGWAGASSYDWAKVDPEHLAQVAVDKCLRSRNAVRIEPGRYTTILEPQAHHDLFSVLLEDPVSALTYNYAVQGVDGAFFKSYRRPQMADPEPDEPVDRRGKMLFEKLGERVVDERITVSHDPADPALGILPFSIDGTGYVVEPYAPITWIERGVLTTLPYDRAAALKERLSDTGRTQRNAYRMSVSGPTQTVEEMIATTKRGLLVTRLWGVHIVDRKSQLSTGVTRDGLWLVENGTITKAVRNLRFTESPLFVLNNIEQLGTPVPVFHPSAPAIIPAIKARDFSFTATTDAV